MYIMPLNTNFQGAGKVRIMRNSAHNKSRVYLYNELSDAVKKYKLPAEFGIEKVDVQYTNPKFIEKLRELGIEFNFIK